MSSSWIPIAQVFSVISLLAVVGYQCMGRGPRRRRSGDSGSDSGSSGDWFGSDSTGHHGHGGAWDSGSGGDSGGDGGGDGGGGGGD